MKHNNSFIFNYQVVETRSFEIDLEKLADLLIKDNRNNNIDISLIIENFGDNIDFYLYKLGLPEEIEIDEYDCDYLYESVYDNLETILKEKLQNQQ